MDLLIRGELDPPQQLPAYAWTTADGMTVRVLGAIVEVEWQTAPGPSSASFDRMQLEVEGALLIENLERIVPQSVRWTEHTELGALGGHTIFAPAIVQSWVARRPSQPLDRNAAKAAVIVTCPEVASALRQFRLAMEAWRGDAAESMARLYLGVEELVLALQGDSSRSDWATTGLATTFGDQRALRLFFSLQFGRHINVSIATASLQKMGVAALSPGECLNAAAEFIDRYIVYRQQHPC